MNEIANDVQVQLEPWVYEDEKKDHEIVELETEEQYLAEVETREEKETLLLSPEPEKPQSFVE